MQQCKQIQELGETIQELQDAIVDSLEDTKILLYALFDCLKLKEKPFSHFYSASKEDISQLWERIKDIDDSMTQQDTTPQKYYSQKPNHRSFLRVTAIIITICSVSRSV